MQKLSFIILLTVLSLFVVLPTNAQEIQSVQTILQEETVTSQDLGVGEPTLLPSSPFYFLKEWTRGIKKALTFNPIKKAELEVRFADEKIAEAKKLSVLTPERSEVITKALENYRSSQARLKAGLALINQTSQNPEVDKLVEKITDRAVKHEKLLSELTQKFDQKPELKAKLDTLKEGLEESMAEASKKDEADKFARKIKKALIEARGSDLKHVRSLEILDRVSRKAGEELKTELAPIREEFSTRLKEGIQEFAKKHQEAPALLKEAFENIPGNRAERVIILEEIQEKAEKRVQKALEESTQVLEKVLEEKEELAEEAKELIEDVKERVAKLEARIKEVGEVPSSITRLAKEAELHLERAISAFDQNRFGEAFGQARSSQVLARNGLRMLEEQKEPEEQDLKEDISELEEETNAWEVRVNASGEELKEKIKGVVETVRFDLRLARESLEEGGEVREAKRHLEEAKHVLRKLERIFHEFSKAPAPLPKPEERKPQPVKEREGIVCTQEFEPVCGEDGKTYSNRCVAEQQHRVKVAYEGECKKREPESSTLPVPPAPIVEPEAKKKPETAPVAPQVTELKVEADDKGFYPTNVLSVPKGSKVKLTFLVRSEGVYYGGLDFRSEKFTTPSIKPGGVTSVEFSADESFTITSYWPASGVKKADLKIEVK